ncbi:MAG: hypothetical protein HC898_04880 [Phycisphaerales bacterium]|nr:hypothetical protein [Phycisphaerales bacterium]
MGEGPVRVQGVDGQGEAVTSVWVLPGVVRHELARAGQKLQVTESGEMVWE